ncbi:hemerythrin domain-containing protein [Gordonia rhizosphera]|uniref:Hemerythrin-like domain-containing protein n=1 Tax=Gordonia rhizosphera NBRC 16068 TaxID=1108045 RepID=K6UZ28_9ACTN|nr:hemerythrin domain-containing protein [Gordonia rhizosphera]GAB88723.1 hypothetical protein GORHZ_037_00310 [Gordonia rhizosphera NBRC 16068]
MTTTTPAATRPTQLVLPGQAAAPNGPVDPFMMYLMHHAFRRDLADFARCAPRTPVADRVTWRRLRDRWADFGEVLHHHHSAEDQIVWPTLTQRADADGRAVLDAMEAEHDLIDPLLSGCALEFDRLGRHRDIAARERLADLLVRTRDCLGAHLAHEETEALVLIQRHFDAEDWELIERQINGAADTGIRDLFRFIPWLLKGIEREDRAAILAKVPGVFRFLAKLGEGRFARAERRTFIYDPAAAI